MVGVPRGPSPQELPSKVKIGAIFAVHSSVLLTASRHRTHLVVAARADGVSLPSAMRGWQSPTRRP